MRGGGLLLAAVLAAFPALALAGEPPLRPDPSITPGVIAITDAAKVCAVRWGRDVRHVTAAMKRHVAEAYGVDPRRPQTEYDHLVSRELGGADAEGNLWPQAYDAPTWHARAKDRLENFLHREVCAGRLPLAEAQREIAADWIGTYKKYLGEP